MDQEIIGYWLRKHKQVHTQRSYISSLNKFMDFTNQKPLIEITAEDIEAYFASLVSPSLATKYQRITSVKSLLTFAFQSGHIPYNVGVFFTLPSLVRPDLENVLSLTELEAMVSATNSPRNKLLLKVLYFCNLQVSEAAALTWEDVSEFEGQLLLVAKGARTKKRTLVAPNDLLKLKGLAAQSDPVFKSQMGGHLDASQIMRITRSIGERAKIKARVSPSLLRKSGAVHHLNAEERPLHQVQYEMGHMRSTSTGHYLGFTRRPAIASASDSESR